MGRELVERAGLGPRASVSAAVARTGPQARASSSNGRRTKKLRGVDEGRFEEKLSQQVAKSALLVPVAACEPHWAKAIYAPLGQRTRGGDGESSQHAERRVEREGPEKKLPAWLRWQSVCKVTKDKGGKDADFFPS